MLAYSKNNKLPDKIAIFNNGGIGDWLLLNSALQEIKRRSSKTKIYILSSHKAVGPLLKAGRNIDGYSILPDYSIFKNNFNYDDDIILSNFFGFMRFTGCKQHQINFAFKIFNLDNKNVKPNIYLNQNDENFGRSYAKLFKNRMIILCNDTSEGFKKWDPKRWERVIKRCANYMFVQIGLNSGKPIKGALNMLGKTTLTQAMSLVKYSKLVVTVDGLFNHVADAFDIPKVILWGIFDPSNFGYYNNTINIWKKIKCSPCTRLTYFPIQKCIKRCTNKEVPVYPQCMLAIEEAEVINAIKKMLKEKHDPSIKYYKFKSVGRNACVDCKHSDICNIDSFKMKFCQLFALQIIF